MNPPQAETPMQVSKLMGEYISQSHCPLAESRPAIPRPSSHHEALTVSPHRLSNHRASKLEQHLPPSYSARDKRPEQLCTTMLAVQGASYSI